MAEPLTGGGSRVKFRRYAGRSRGQQARSRSRARGGAPAGICRGGGAAGRRGRGSARTVCAAKQGAAVVLRLGLEAAAGGDVRGHRGAGCQLKEMTGDLGVRARA